MEGKVHRVTSRLYFSIGQISTKMDNIVEVNDIIIYSSFGFNILVVLEIYRGVKISIFLLALLVIITTVLLLLHSLCSHAWDFMDGN